MNNRIWLSPPHMGGGEMKYVQEAFDTNWIAPVGENLRQFERALCQYTGAKYALALNSGTAAIHLALVLLGVKPGDEVICPTFTFVATINPVLYQGATPIFVDSDYATWNMCPETAEEAIRDRQRRGRMPKALLITHLYGQAARVDRLTELAARYGIPVVEDAAAALGSSYGGRKLGSFGRLGILSFNGNKIVTTSGGGALLSNEHELIEQARFLSTQARDPAPHFQHSQVGYNYALSNVLAGIGRGQMEVLEERIWQRRANFDFYRAAFAAIPALSFAPEPEPSFSNRWLTCLLIDETHSGGVTRETLRLALETQNIEARPLWKPMHQQPIYQEYPYYGSGVAEDLFTRGLCLPSGTNLSPEDLSRVANVVQRAFGQ